VSLCVGDILCGLVVNRGDEISFSDASERRFAARVYPRYPEGLVEIGASVQPEPPRRTSVQDNFASCHGLLDIGVGPVGPQPTRSLAHSTLTLVGATIIDQNRHSADNARPWDLFRSPDDCSDWLGLEKCHDLSYPDPKGVLGGRVKIFDKSSRTKTTLLSHHNLLTIYIN
jgi:hypothetical protein